MADRTYEGPYAATELFLPDGRSTIVGKGGRATGLPEDFAAALDSTGDWAGGAAAKVTKAELLEEAANVGVDVPADAKKADVEALLAAHAAGIQAPEGDAHDAAESGEES